MRRPARLLAALLLLPGLAWAQPRAFSCVGAEQLEEDVAALAFPRASDTLPEEAAALLAGIASAARAMPERNLCVLGFASPQEGGAQTASRLAARRARAVALELARLGVERDRVRAEARTRGFATGGVDRRPGVRVVLMPLEPDAR